MLTAISESVAHQEYRLIIDIFIYLDAFDRQLLRRFGLTPTQYNVLLHLDPLSGQQLVTLSDLMLVARSTISRIIDQMEAAELVHRVTDPDDRRAQRVVLTRAGVDLRDRVHEAHGKALEEYLSGVDLAEQEELLLLLRKMRSGLAANVGDGN
ncbi:MAG: MarR family transcriptional regulator [Anaerolineae bacterium]|uniref:MarR family winged helix-turn-helix transcriptional regulator n=1 Tax=Candidatus Flexifilum breve TaxID=3140694 RepID=UPI001AC1B5C5|nr:MarR family transcriptional regulator [Chloroflexota bacterium]MBN8637261.1 MarR family transcriptional regulator [Anaerolineae bacterium]